MMTQTGRSNYQNDLEDDTSEREDREEVQPRDLENPNITAAPTERPQLMFGGAVMFDGGLLNTEFFTTSNEELVSLFGGLEGFFNMSSESRPSFAPFELKETIILRNDVNIQQQTIVLACSGERNHSLRFKFDVRSAFLDECTVRVYFKAKEQRTSDGLVRYESTTAQLHLAPKTFSVTKTESGNHENIDNLEYTRSDYNGSTSEEYISEDITIDLSSIFSSRDEMSYPSSSDLTVHIESEMRSLLIPLVIELKSETSSQFSLCSLEYQSSDNTYLVKVNKQKVIIGKELFEVAEIYGDNRQQSADQGTMVNEIAQDEENLCVICMSEKTNTAVLPCRHMSMCMDCANALRNQTNKCPICRQRVESIVKIPTKENESD